MAELTNKLHVKLEASVFDCTCYTTTDEATPKTVSNGSYWEIKNNNTVCYLGLVPSASADTTGFDTPLKVKKNNTEYIVQAKVVNYFTVSERPDYRLRFCYMVTEYSYYHNDNCYKFQR